MEKYVLKTDGFEILDQNQCTAVSGGNWKLCLEALKYASFAYEALQSFMAGVAEGWKSCSDNN